MALRYVLHMFYCRDMRIDRLNRLALRVLEDAVARAACGDVERTIGHRLALEFLVQAGIAERWQAATFWDDLAWQSDRHNFDHNVTYMQSTSLRSGVHAWAQRMGLRPLDPVQEARLEYRYAPDLEFGSGTQQLPCMCNRYMPGDRQAITSYFGARQLRDFNDGPAIVHPKEQGWVVRMVDGERTLEQMTWGFPFYVRGKAGQPLRLVATNNARFESFERTWKRWAHEPGNRCLIPAAGYAEAEGPKGSMTTTWLSVRDQPLFAWAGLWRDSDEWGASYTGVMTQNAPELLRIHDRAPVILRPDQWDTWLTAPFDDLQQFHRPWPASETVVKATRVLWKVGGGLTQYGEAGPLNSP